MCLGCKAVSEGKTVSELAGEPDYASNAEYGSCQSTGTYK